MGDIFVSPWLVWAVGVSKTILVASIVVALLGSIYLSVMAYINIDKPIPYVKTITVVTIVAWLSIFCVPTPDMIVRIVTANYVTADTTDVEYEMLMQRVCNILGVKIK